MVDNLYTFDEIRAALPDNTSNLISPENTRSASLSLATDAGEVGDGSQWVLALTAGVPANLNALSPAPDSEILRGWAVDGNAALFANFAAEGFTIAPGHLRGINATALIIAENAGGADDTFTVDLLKGATIVSSSAIIMQGGAQAEEQVIGVAALESYEPGLQEPWSIQITSLAGNDLNINDWDLKVWGMPI